MMHFGVSGTVDVQLELLGQFCHDFYFCVAVDIYEFIYTDINECTRNISGCEDTCENTEGSYLCVCNSGLVLAADNHNCTGE